MLVPAAAAQGFDQSLDGLVRQRVITSQERKLLRGGGAAVPIQQQQIETIGAGFVEKVFCGPEADAGVPLIGDFSTDQLLNARIIFHDCNTKSLGGLLN